MTEGRLLAERGRRAVQRALFVGGIAVALGGCRIEPTNARGDGTTEEPDLAARAAAILETQAEAWNAGDLDGFMAFYDRSPATTYIGSAGLVEGFDGIRARYAPLFEAGAQRDSLRFEDVHARALDPRFGVVTARYVLYSGPDVTSTGPFTLVLMRVEGRWKIVHDQSAADPEPES